MRKFKILGAIVLAGVLIAGCNKENLKVMGL